MALCQAAAMPDRPTIPPLHGWTVLSLRPRGQHAGLRAAAARRGARLLALSPLAIEGRDDATAHAALAGALACPLVLFTSPNAVRAAAALQPLRLRRGQRALAVGDGTRRALRRFGVDADAPARMDSEGLLALPALQEIEGVAVGLVAGAGGRGVLAPALQARGARVLRADVYARVPQPLAAPALARLRAALADPRRVLLPLSSGEALRQVSTQLPEPLRARFARIAVAAASARLADAARAAGFRRVAIATDARAASLLDAAVRGFV